MGISVSSLPNLATPIANTLILGVDSTTTPNTSVNIRFSDFQRVAVTPAFNKANTANVHANLAFTQANTAFDNAAIADAKAEIAITTSGNADANSVIAINKTIELESKLFVVWGNSNNIFTHANLAFTKANSAYTLADRANTTGEAAFTKANSAFDVATVADNNAQSAVSLANEANTFAFYANSYARIAYDNASLAYSLAETANNNAVLSYDKANTATSDLANTNVRIDNTEYLIGLFSANKPIKVNVLDFGAIGDGVTDDSAAIQSAIDFYTNARIYVPEGTYSCQELLLSPNKTIEGSGPHSTIFLPRANSANVFTATANTELYPTYSNIGIKNLGISSNSYIDCKAINIIGVDSSNTCSSIRLETLNISGATNTEFSTAISFAYCKDFFVRNSTFGNNNIDVYISDSVKGQIVNNICNSSNNVYNIVESGVSNNNIFMGNIVTNELNVIGTNSIKVNNIENV